MCRLRCAGGDPGGGRDNLRGHANDRMAPGVFSLRSHTPSRGEGGVAWALMPTLFQGAVREGSLTTAAAAAETPLSTCEDEDEEASRVPTGGPPSIIPTAAPEQAVTFVSAPSILCGSQEAERSASRDRSSSPPPGQMPTQPVGAPAVGADFREAGGDGGRVTGVREADVCPDPATS